MADKYGEHVSSNISFFSLDIKKYFLVTEAHGVSDQMSTAVAGLVLRGISHPRVWIRDEEGGIKTNSTIGSSRRMQISLKGTCAADAVISFTRTTETAAPLRAVYLLSFSTTPGRAESVWSWRRRNEIGSLRFSSQNGSSRGGDTD